ncbi:hypothetical protein IscW_ISCW018472 [Ixodes scapularis]|uniref:Uncharacterized protein n=1 Tax=Ixodes scapularis TaxID=6945 RepID=B7PKN8_IXOSC|nr:hypothetical protein IscW_ISCW018472 [Ixodes scapularis]|eukprot:XP_002434336.1 hypothetical protein IscW_ISCW018472 [Ixodes scapularis]
MLMLHMAYYEQAENAPSRELLEVGMTMARSLPPVALSWGLTRAMWLTSLNDICHLENDMDFIQVRPVILCAKLGKSLTIRESPT